MFHIPLVWIAMLRRTRFINCAAILVSLSLGLAFSVVWAGIRGPGKYSGVVIFDRWDSCLLLSVNYLTYISEDAKEDLRRYRNQAIQIDILDVIQRANPGDGVVRKLAVLGPAPDFAHNGPIDNLQIEVASDFSHGRDITFSIEMTNSAAAPIEVDTDEIGPTLLGLRVDRPFGGAGDGRSMAWITRASLRQPDGWASSDAWSGSPLGRWFFAAYVPDPSSMLPARLILEPHASRLAKVGFALVPGPYEFLVGYGGGVHEGRSIASNAVPFHVEEDGTPVLDE